MTSPGTRRDTRVRTRTAEPTFATWRGPVEGVTCDLCSDCKRAGVVP